MLTLPVGKFETPTSVCHAESPTVGVIVAPELGSDWKLSVFDDAVQPRNAPPAPTMRTVADISAPLSAA
jgi:hypothetical protein